MANDGYTNGSRCLLGVRLTERVETLTRTVGEHDDEIKHLRDAATRVGVVMAGLGFVGSIVGGVVTALVIGYIQGGGP